MVNFMAPQAVVNNFDTTRRFTEQGAADPVDLKKLRDQLEDALYAEAQANRTERDKLMDERVSTVRDVLALLRRFNYGGGGGGGGGAVGVTSVNGDTGPAVTLTAADVGAASAADAVALDGRVTALENAPAPVIPPVKVPMLAYGGNLSLFSGSQATKGAVITVNQNVDVKGIAFMATLASGGTYKGKLVALNGSNQITSVLGTGTYVAAANSTVVGLEFPFPSPVTLSPGTTYAVFLSRTDGAANFALPVLGCNNGYWPANGINSSATLCNHSTVVDPGVGATLTTGGGPYYGAFLL